MKKILFGLGIITLIGISCNKINNSIKPETKSIKTTRTENILISFKGHNYNITNGMLDFKTFSEYEELFSISQPFELDIFASDVENSSAMTTYSKHLLPHEKQNLYLISSIVNEYGMIKIDEFTLLLNFPKKVIYATRYGTSNDLINARNGNISSQVYQLNMEGKETIDALVEIKTRGLFCQESYASSKNASNNGAPLATNISGISESIEVKYSQYGIYYSLMTYEKMNLPTTSYNGAYPHFHCVTTGWWQRRCSSVSGTINQTLNFNPYGYVNSNSQWYSNVRALKHFNVTRILTSNNSILAGNTHTININD